MESNRFDTLARQLSTMGTRRKAIVSLAGAGLGLATLQIADTDARKKRKKRKKRCKQLGAVCKPTSKRKCCTDLSCEVRPGASNADCCIPIGGVCNVAEDCCQGVCLANLVLGGPKKCTVVSA